MSPTYWHRVPALVNSETSRNVEDVVMNEGVPWKGSVSGKMQVITRKAALFDTQRKLIPNPFIQEIICAT